MKKAAIFLLFLVLLISQAWTTSSDSTGFIETRLNDRVLLLHHAPWAETMTVIDAGSYLVVVDTWGSLVSAKKARVRIDKIFHKAIRYVINTHHHWDHTFGNAAFPGAEIVGHRFCAEDMNADYAGIENRKARFEASASNTPLQSLRDYISSIAEEASNAPFLLLPPNRLIGERDTLHAGSLTILLYHTPGIHTRSNLTAFIPELGILFGRSEFADAAQLKLEQGADPKSVCKTLEDILALNKPIHSLIPGHGQPIENPNLKAALARLKDLRAKKP